MTQVQQDTGEVRDGDGESAPLPAPRNPVAWTIAGSLIGLGLLYAATRRVDAATLKGILESADWTWVIAVLAATAAFCWLKSLRWALLLRFVPGATTRGLQAAVYAGLAINFLVAHVGEIYRAALVARNLQAPWSAVFATVVIERVLDFAAMLVLFGIIILLVPRSPTALLVASAASAGLIVLAISGLYALLRPPAWTVRTANKLAASFPPGASRRIAAMISRFRDGLASLGNPRLLLLALFLSAIQWALVAAAIASCARAVHVPASLIATTVTFVLIILGLTLPNSPMQIGTTQLAFVVGFGSGRASDAEAIAASLVYTAFLIIPIMLAGGAVLLRSRTAKMPLQRADGRSP